MERDPPLRPQRPWRPSGEVESVLHQGPAISAYILDSDVADVEALTPDGQFWRTYLHPDTAASYGAPALSQTPAEVLGAALEWSAQAGLTADAEAVEEALTAHSVEAEDTLDELVTALGVP